MPNTTPPSRSRTVHSGHSAFEIPKFISLAAPVKIPRKPSAKAGASVANTGKIKTSKKVKGEHSTSQA